MHARWEGKPVLALVSVSGAGVIGRRIILSDTVDLGRVGESAGVGVGISFWCWGS
jgi:hypothetical protein